MTIRFTTVDDISVLLSLFEQARTFMRTHGNVTQWVNGYPSREVVEDDIAKQQSYVCEQDGEIMGSFVMMRGEEVTYRVIEGAWKNDLPYVTAHRVVSSGKQRGMGTLMLQWVCEQEGNVRGDTHADNLPMQRAFENAGFERCGKVWMLDGTERIAYHRIPKEEHP